MSALNNDYLSRVGVEPYDGGATPVGLDVLLDPDNDKFSLKNMWERTSGTEAIDRVIPDSIRVFNLHGQDTTFYARQAEPSWTGMFFKFIFRGLESIWAWCVRTNKEFWRAGLYHD